MTDIPPDLASNAVNAFLASQYDKKTETEQKQLAKAIEDKEHEKALRVKRNLSRC